MEWNRRVEQGERGRRRAFVLEALPCSRLQRKVLQYPGAIKTITLHVLIILKSASTRSGAKNRNHRQLRRFLVSLTAPQGLSQSGCTAGLQSTSLAPQDLKRSQSSAGFIKIVESAAGIIVDIVGSAGHSKSQRSAGFVGVVERAPQAQ